MASAEAAIRALSDPEREVSAHYLIDETGFVFRLVDEDMRAWHAGQGTWRGLDDINSRSIGIEISNDGKSPYSAKQMRSLHGLLRDILARWNLKPESVIGHSDMAPTRKIDPGPRFDWRGLARAGLSVWPKDQDAPQDAFRSAALAFGYPDVDDDLLLSTFRLRFRPWATGPLQPRDAGLATDLAERFGV